MTWFTNLKTASKLLAFFGLMLAMLGAMALEGITSAGTMKASQEATFEIDLKSLAFVLHTTSELRQMSSTVRDAVIQTDPVKKDALIREFDDYDRKLRASFDTAEGFCKDEGARKMIAAIAKEGYPVYMQAARDAIAASVRGTDAGDPARMMAGVDTMNAISVKGSPALIAQSDRLWAQAQARAVASQTAYEHSLRTMGIVFLLVAIAGGLFTRAITRAIAKPLEATVEVLDRVAEGDLTARLELDRTDEVGDGAMALNSSIESMRNTLAKVAEVSNDVSSASSELASNAQAISAGAQEQAASLEETAASLEEISSTVKQNTDNAQEASQLANSARDAAERGGQVVSSAVSAMEEITRSSKKIADIITTIDEIAFQTNLLALNAAVEAARAGEQGRGFGVVAAEVRTLAQRTGTAAKEIRGLIADSTTKVEVGTHQVNESGKTLEEIVRSVKRVTDMVAEIAAASREQNTGLDHVNTAVTQVDQVTQSNAAQTEELSATATSLSDKSTELQALVAAFDLGGAGGAPRKKAAPASASRAHAAPAHSSVMPVASRRTAPKKVANGGYEEF